MHLIRGVLVSNTMDVNIIQIAYNIRIQQHHPDTDVISQGEHPIFSTKVITLLVILSNLNFCLTFQTTHLLEKMLEGLHLSLLHIK